MLIGAVFEVFGVAARETGGVDAAGSAEGNGEAVVAGAATGCWQLSPTPAQPVGTLELVRLRVANAFAPAHTTKARSARIIVRDVTGPSRLESVRAYLAMMLGMDFVVIMEVFCLKQKSDTAQVSYFHSQTGFRQLVYAVPLLIGEPHIKMRDQFTYESKTSPTITFSASIIKHNAYKNWVVLKLVLRRVLSKNSHNQ